MRAARSALSAIAESLIPDGTLVRVRTRASLDTLTTLGVTLAAVVLAVGYQVLGRWARRSDPDD
jgi:hypothetical protein